MNGPRLGVFFTIFVLSMISGCASQVTRPQATVTAKPVVKALQSFSVELSPEAKEQLADNIKFDRTELSSTIKRTLEARNLLAEEGDFRLKVLVNDIRIRSAFSAVMWGFMAGDDHVKGDVVLLNREDEPVYTFGVNVSYALGGIGGGQDSRVNWLYEEFAEKIADELVAQRDQSE